MEIFCVFAFISLCFGKVLGIRCSATSMVIFRHDEMYGKICAEKIESNRALVWKKSKKAVGKYVSSRMGAKKRSEVK